MTSRKKTHAGISATCSGVPHPVSAADQAGDRGGGLTEAPAVPVPPRFWWLKRLGAVAIAFLLLLVGVCLWWGHVAESRLRAKIAEYRAAGQPLFPEDFQKDPIPEEDNAAYYLKQAAAKLTHSSTDINDLRTLLRDPRTRAANTARTAKFIDAEREPLRLARAGRDKTHADWQVVIGSPMINVLLPDLKGQRTLSKLLALAALYEHETGNDNACVEIIFDELGLAARVDDTGPFIIAHLVRMATEALAIEALEGVAHELRVINDPTNRGPGARPATREQVELLIAALLDERDLREGWTSAVLGERALELDTAKSLWQGQVFFGAFVGGAAPPGSSFFGWTTRILLSPAWKLDASRMMEWSTSLMNAGTELNWQTARHRLPPEPSPTGPAARQFATLLSRILYPSLERSLQLHFRCIAFRRMAATALAMRLYELDHGERPTTLSELVPEYLDAIPLDPFAGDARPLSYAPDAPSPLLYSVGINGIHEGGKFALKRSGEVDADAHDIPFFLTGDRPFGPPPQAPSAQAVDDE